MTEERSEEIVKVACEVSNRTKEKVSGERERKKEKKQRVDTNEAAGNVNGSAQEHCSAEDLTKMSEENEEKKKKSKHEDRRSRRFVN